MARLAILIDGGYLTKISEPLGLWLDFKKLSSAIQTKISAEVEEPLDLLRTYYYDCLPWKSDPPTEDEKAKYSEKQKFFTVLRNLPRFDVREGRLRRIQRRNSGRPIFVQKRVDLLIGMDMARLCLRGRVSHIALLSGDSDFLPAIEVAKDEGVSVWLLHGDEGTYARDLRQKADDAFLLDREFLLFAARDEDERR